MLMNPQSISFVDVERNVVGKNIKSSYIQHNFDHNNLFSSQSGYTRHKASCDADVSANCDRTSQLLFTCNDCGKSFGEKRYLIQHMGSKKCVKRKAYLETSNIALGCSTTDSSGEIKVSQHSLIHIRIILIPC